MSECVIELIKSAYGHWTSKSLTSIKDRFLRWKLTLGKVLFVHDPKLLQNM